MKFRSATALSLLITATQALASSGAADAEGMSLLATFFIAFAALIVLFQFVPGMALFVSMLKGIFTPQTGKAVGQGTEQNRTNL